MAAASIEDELAPVELLAASVNKGLGKLECDVELLDLEYCRLDPLPNQPVCKDSSIKCASKLRTRPRPRHISPAFEIPLENNLDGWSPAARRAEHDLEMATNEVARLETIAKTDAQQRVANASSTLALLRERCRTERGQCLAGLTKRHVVEVRHLARSPPDAVRRTLTALWLLLSGDLFRGRGADRLDDVREWAQCRKNLLADENFVARLIAFDARSIDAVPLPALRLAASRIGLQMESAETDTATADLLTVNSFASLQTSFPSTLLNASSRPQTGARDAASTQLASNMLPRLSCSGSTIDGKVASLPQDGRSVPPWRPRISSSSSSPLLQRHSSTAPAVIPQALNLTEVQWASEPCGALLRWMHALLQDSVARRIAQENVVVAEAALKATESELCAARDVAARAENNLAEARRVASPTQTPVSTASSKRIANCRSFQGSSTIVFKEATMSLHKGVWRQQSYQKRRLVPGACSAATFAKSMELSGCSPRSPSARASATCAWPRSPAGCRSRN